MSGDSLWIILTGVLATSSCGLLGTFLVLRKMSLLGDALSHAVLPGIAIAFLLSDSRAVLPMFLGAALSGIVTTLWSKRSTRSGAYRKTLRSVLSLPLFLRWE